MVINQSQSTNVVIVVAAIIELLDADTQTAYTRALVLAILTGLIGLGCAVVVAFDIAAAIRSCRASASAAKRRRRTVHSSRKSLEDAGGNLVVKVVGGDD